MDDWNLVVSLVEDFAQSVLEYIPIPFEDDDEYIKEYDELFDMLTRDLYIYTLMVLKKFS